MTGTRQGEWIFIGEGGSLAFIDTGLGQAGFDDAAKRIPIGKTGVIPVRMALDPESAQVPGAGANDLLYIAGGRHGLWVMQADVSAVVVNHAARVDDSGVFNSGLQRSRRWCCDVDFIQIGSERFLLALFQKRGGSRLRLYPLNAARAVIQGQETGSEIQAEFEVRLGSHPFPPIKAANSFAGSMAMAMEVDVVDATPGTEVIDVYVAMGFHGLVRVRLTRDNFLAFTPNPTAPVKSWGPVFGDGTPYTTGGTLVPVGSDPVWYKNLEWVDLDNEAHPGIDLLERSEPPLFADVAVQNQGQDHYLYVAVDHLNWVRFDLDVPWNEQTPISHHEGVPVANHPWGETTFEVVPIKTNGILQHGYTRSLELVQADPDSQGLGLLLVTTVDLNGFHRGSDHFTEGFSFDTVFGLGGVLARFPGGSRTVVYNLADPLGAVPSWNMETWIDFGGRVLFVPPDQDRTPGQVDRLWVVHNNRVDPVANGLDVKANFATCLSEFDVPVTWDGQAPPDPFLTLVRSKCDIPGRKSFRIGHSLVDPDLLLMGNNDALTADGFLVTGQVGGIDVIRSHYDPTLDPCGDDRRGGTCQQH